MRIDDEATLALAVALWQQVRLDLAGGRLTQIVNGALVPARHRCGRHSEAGADAIATLRWLDSDDFADWCGLCFGEPPDAVRARLMAAWTGPDPTGLALWTAPGQGRAGIRRKAA